MLIYLHPSLLIFFSATSVSKQARFAQNDKRKRLGSLHRQPCSVNRITCWDAPFIERAGNNAEPRLCLLSQLASSKKHKPPPIPDNLVVL
ncbi:MAG: hypothetical protein ACKO45_15460, partial [Cyanobium sp.]